jgi:hypothetical protein
MSRTRAPRFSLMRSSGVRPPRRILGSFSHHSPNVSRASCHRSGFSPSSGGRSGASSGFRPLFRIDPVTKGRARASYAKRQYFGAGCRRFRRKWQLIFRTTRRCKNHTFRHNSAYRRHMAPEGYGGDLLSQISTLVLRGIHTIHQAMTHHRSYQIRYTGESRCPRQKWIPAFAGKARRGRRAASTE